jgi:diguanylate cyclase (GGDEF)-like protein
MARRTAVINTGVPRIRGHSTLRFVAPVLMSLTVMLIAAIFSIELLSTIRAWVGGEGLYSKGQKNATFYLSQYALTQDEQDYRLYRSAISYPLGDLRARLALQRRPPDVNAARQGLLEGGSNAADIGSIIVVFRLFSHVGQVRDAVVTWTEGDGYTLQLCELAARLRPEDGHAISAADKQQITTELNRINRELTPLAARFSSTLGDLARTTRTLLIAVLTLGTLVTSALCIRVTRARVRERDLKEQGLARLSEFYAALSQASQLVSRVSNQEQLFDELCKICVGTRGIELAGVGMRSDSSANLEFISVQGEPRSYLQLRSAQSQLAVVQGAVAPPADEQPWVSNGETGPGRLFPSEASFPLKRQGLVIGALCVFASEQAFFKRDIVELMAQLAQEASFALDTLHHDSERRRQAAVLAEQNRILNLIASGAELEFILNTLAAFVEAQSGRSCALLARNADGTLSGVGRSPALPRELSLPDYDDHLPQCGSQGPEQRTIFGGKRQSLGVLVLYSGDGRAVADDAQSMEICVNLAGIAIESSAAAERIRHLAHHDELTGLPNRLMFHLQVPQALARAKRTGRSVALMFFDLDRFKVINDTLGHEAGDNVLRQIAQHLRGCARHGDTLARVGGDEFTLLVEQFDQSELLAIVTRLLAALASPLTVSGQVYQLSGSIGIAVYPKDGMDGPTLLKNADIAMYRAKASGRNQFQFYSSDMDEHTVERLTLENDLRNAIAQKEFEVYYQPKIAIRTGAVVGAEALVRWRHPRRGLLLPGEFIRVAEEMGLIGEIGGQVLASVCRTIVLWRQRGLATRVAVNLSARQFSDSQLLEQLEEVLLETKCDPGALEFEITESVVMSDPDRAVTLLEYVKSFGITIAIDDFGTGHSSLAYLKRFPVDRVKIDYVFVRDLALDPDDSAIIRAIIALGHSLNMSVVAEGVETDEQLQMLSKLGCDEYQGFLCSEAVPEARFAQLMTDLGTAESEIDEPRPYAPSYPLPAVRGGWQ